MPSASTPEASRKIVLVTGAGTGMGRATVRHFAENGFTVYAGTRDPSRLEKECDTRNVSVLPLDITSEASVNEAVRTVLSERGGIDVLVNNAGYGLVSAVEHVTEAEMLAQFDVNVFGVLRMCRAVVPAMRQGGGGVIVNISSFLGKIGLPLLTFYNASKYALEGITDSLRYELHDFGIRVHSVMPGFFDTQFARSNLRTNAATFAPDSPYAKTVATLAPVIVDQINHGNDPGDVARLILEIVENDTFPARVTAGDKARKFIPMRRELSDEDFERRVREYYDL
jgi:NAD(P)-dependent dehydrogenase (short-subunit alcohol dehydrogenase family)